MTIFEEIKKAQSQLARAGCDSARLDAEILLAHILKCERFALYQKEFNSNFPEKKFKQLIERRAKKEPIAYIIGYKEFWSLPVKANKDALIPRPETEHLVEKALLHLPEKTDMKVLDIGTGSGCILAALAKERPELQLTGYDPSQKALKIAKENLCSLFPCAREKIKLLTLLPSPSGENHFFDLIISNPPYIPTDEIKNLEPDVVLFEPHSALDGGPDGLTVFREILEQAPNLLKPGGWLLFEIGIGQEEPITKMLMEKNFSKITSYPDLQGISRVLEGQWKN